MISLDKIITGCVKNRSKYQKILFDKYAEQMKFICIRYLSDEADAQDALQEGFIKLFKNIKQFENTGHFEAWMSRIFVNTALGMIRKTKRRKEEFTNHESDIDHPSEDMKYEEPIDLSTINSKTFNLDHVIEAEFSKEDLMKCINTLESDFRLVFNLYFIEGFKHQEIASALQIKEQTSRSRLMRARQKIQKELYSMTLQRLTLTL